MRDATDIEYRGRRRWAGNYGRVWINGSMIFEIKAFEAKVSIDREDVIIGISKDSKVVSLTGEGSITIVKVFDRGYKEYLENQKAGHDVRFTIIASIEDPDTVGGQKTRIQIENVWFNEIPVMNFSKGEVVEDELQFQFTPEDVSYLETVQL